MKKRQGMTLVELLVVILVVAIIAGILIPALARQREEGRRLRCRENLNQLAKGMARYFGFEGDDRFYPCPLGRGCAPSSFNGAEWLASLYWRGILPCPEVWLCPSTADTNANGKDIGSKRANDSGGTFGPQTVSYAAMWWKSVATVNGGALRDDFLPNEPMACDDTQGGINHGTAADGGMNVMFFDSHVEFVTTPKVDVTSQTGSVGFWFPNPPKTPLWRLKN